MDKISVIIPVYKVEKYLDQCVESVVGQSYTELEIILVDDGSPDSCPRKCDEWARRDGRIRVIHQENRGLSGARNSGIEAMTGDYLTFVDSDDVLHPEVLERLYRAAVSGGCDMSVCSLVRFADGETPAAAEEVGEAQTVSAQEVLRLGTLLNRSEACGKLYRKSVFDDLRFVEGITYEDTQILPYVLQNCEKICIIPDGLYFYRKNVGGIMSSGINERKFCVFDIYAEHIRLYRGLGMTVSGSKAYQALVARTVKASVICKGRLRGRFYKTFFKNLPLVILAPPRYLGLKNKLLYLSTALPFGAFRSYYKRKLGASVSFGDTDNF